jgi:DNA polymerase I-like protein with 3'-5' exonuclease and polymerase domains
MTYVSHDPRQCREALARTASPVVLDLETTGLRRWNQIVSVGLLVDDVAYILFARSMHVSVRNLPFDTIREALQPLARPDLIVIAHNALFDLGFLFRAGIRVQGEVRDTLKLLRLLDQDRGGDHDSSARRRPRRDLTAPEGSPVPLNYKLKNVAGQLLGIKMPNFPGAIELAPYKIHATYLTCDVTGTKALHDYLWPMLSDGEQTYYRQIVAPLLPVLVEMTNTGVAVDANFIVTESQKLDDLMKSLSEQHRLTHGLSLQMDNKQMIDWLFGRLRLPVIKWKRYGKKRVPSLDSAALSVLEKYAEDERAINSLKLIQQYRQAASLLPRLRSLTKHIDRATGRIYSTFDDKQSSGRISSTNPNLQQLAKAKKINEQEFRTRNVLRASTGMELAVFDIAQADIRVLAHMVESFPLQARAYKDQLRRQREEFLRPSIAPYVELMERQANVNFARQTTRAADYDPTMPADLAADFRSPGDFYFIAAGRILGRQPKDKAERNRYKAIILSIVNGLGAPSLARTLGVSKAEAAQFLAEDFERAYPKVTAYKRLMYSQIAITGQTYTFMNRLRTVTAHRWLVTEPRVEMLVSYRRGDAYWLDVVPLRPSLRVLTTYVRRAWNARTSRLIYDAERGRLTDRPYSLFDTDELQYRLPIRNWGWRSIRRVRARGEEADYEGFDATARAAFNFICQGGTSDISKIMMLRSQPICREFGARLLVQIHDELVFEVPQEKTQSFLPTMKRVLETPPVPEFQVPIVVEAKRGFAFGSLTEVRDL